LSSAETASSRITSPWRQRQRAGDVDALPLAAGNLVADSGWRRFRPQADLAEQLAPPAPAMPHRPRRGPWDERDRFLDGEARIERGIAVLNTICMPRRSFAQRQRAADLHAVIDISPASRVIRCIKSRAVVDCRSRFADDPDGLALGDRKNGHIVDRAHGLALAEQLAAQTGKCLSGIDLQQLAARRRRRLDRLKQFGVCLAHERPFAGMASLREHLSPSGEVGAKPGEGLGPPKEQSPSPDCI